MDHTSQTKGLAAGGGGQKYLTPPNLMINLHDLNRIIKR
jgi:hypothetical protein